MNEESFKKLLDYVSDIASRLRSVENYVKMIKYYRAGDQRLFVKLEELYEHHENVQRRLKTPPCGR